MLPRLILTTLILIFALTLQLDADEALRARNDAIIVRALERMPGFDYRTDQHAKAAVLRHLERSKGTPEYLNLVKKFQPDGIAEKLAAILVSDVGDSTKVEAAKVLGEVKDGPQQIRGIVFGEDAEQGAQMARILGLLGNGRAVRILSDVASDPKRPFEVRKNAVVGLARNKAGEASLISMAEKKSLAADTRMLTGGLLARSKDAKVREVAGQLLPQPQQKDRKPLPPIDQLAKLNGNADNGLKLFRGVATCANCHIVDKFGKEVGPNLSEIGSKLSREAMLTSILDPSAGISHNYENFIVLTASGQVINGLKISETPQEIVIRTVDAIDRKIPQQEVDEVKKSDKSIMPDNLHHTVDQQGLIDIVQYMTNLKKK